MFLKINPQESTREFKTSIFRSIIPPFTFFPKGFPLTFPSCTESTGHFLRKAEEAPSPPSVLGATHGTRSVLGATHCTPSAAMLSPLTGGSKRKPDIPAFFLSQLQTQAMGKKLGMVISQTSSKIQTTILVFVKVKAFYTKSLTGQ